MRLPLAASALAVAAVTACSSSAPTTTCTLIAAIPGIAVTVNEPPAAAVADLQAHACWDGQCRDTTVVLNPRSGVGATSCATEACAAQFTPLPGKYGTVNLPGITTSPVALTLTLRDASGAPVGTRAVTVTPRISYPNGTSCGGDAPQGKVTVTADGITADP